MLIDKFKVIDELTINNIILDLGGVVLDIDYTLTLAAFKCLGIKIVEVSTLTGQNEFFNQFDCGLISPELFRQKFNQLFHSNLSQREFDEAWNALLLDWDVERLNLIEELRKKHRVFLLSNTNSIHFNHYNQMLYKKTGRELKDYFHKAYLSFELGMRKPQPEIFQRLIIENNLNPFETIFIDDTKEHINAAHKLGIQAFLLKGANSAFPLKSILATLM